jgi:phosphatidylglycerol:prolipoprotein diacylglycerol transferase
VQPELDILGLPLKTFGMAFGLAFVVSGAIVGRGLKELGKPVDWAYEMVFSALVGGLIGARLYWLAQNSDVLGDDLLGSLFGGSGLTWYGGALGGALAVVIWARRRGFLNRSLLDVCAPALAMGYAVGRVGCQISGDGDYGGPSDLPWAMAYPDGIVPTDVVSHPSPIYETLAMGLVAWLLWRSRHALRPGLLFAAYLVLAGAQRFLVEFVRRNDEVLAALTAAQFESLALAAAGAVWLVIAARRGGLRASPGPPGPAAASA